MEWQECALRQHLSSVRSAELCQPELPVRAIIDVPASHSATQEAAS